MLDSTIFMCCLLCLLVKILKTLLNQNCIEFQIMFRWHIPIVKYSKISDVFMNTFLIDIEVFPVLFLSQPQQRIVYILA